MDLSAHCLYARHSLHCQSELMRERERKRARARTRFEARRREVRRARVRYNRLPWRARRWLAVDRATGHPVPNREGRRRGAARRGATRPGSTRDQVRWRYRIRGEWTLSLTEIGHFPSMQRASGYERTAREMLTALTLTLHDAVDAARSLSLGREKSRCLSIHVFLSYFFMMNS